MGRWLNHILAPDTEKPTPGSTPPSRNWRAWPKAG